MKLHWYSLFLLALSLTAAAPLSAQSLLDRLEKRLNDIAPPRAPNELPPPSATKPGFLGLTGDAKNGAVTIIATRAGGPADSAGIKPGDRLVSLGGTEVSSLDDISAVVIKLPAGSTIDVVINRGGANRTVKVTLGAREPDPGPRVEEDLPALPQERVLPQGRATLGVRALPVTADLQRQYGLVIGRGAIIESIQHGSPAERYGLPLGAAIVAVDGARINTPDDLAASIAAARPGDTVELSYYVRDQIFRKRVRLSPGAAEFDDPRAAPLDQGDPFAAIAAQLDAIEKRIADLDARLSALEGKPKPNLKGEEPPAGNKIELRPPLEKGPLDKLIP
jgi:predicted metalloprotease with PDZ domain